MSCDLSQGRQRPCKDSVGGLKAVYFLNYGESAYDVSFDATNTDQVDGFGTGLTCYRYDLKGNSKHTYCLGRSSSSRRLYLQQIREERFLSKF